jgi:hypothetical protein
MAAARRARLALREPARLAEDVVEWDQFGLLRGRHTILVTTNRTYEHGIMRCFSARQRKQ